MGSPLIPVGDSTPIFQSQRIFELLRASSHISFSKRGVRDISLRWGVLCPLNFSTQTRSLKYELSSVGI